MFHIDTNQSMSLQMGDASNKYIMYLYTQNIDLCTSYLSEFRDFTFFIYFFLLMETFTTMVRGYVFPLQGTQLLVSF